MDDRHPDPDEMRLMGHGRRRRFWDWRPRVAERIAASPHPNPKAPIRPLQALLLATAASGATTLVASLLLRVFDLSNVVMLFLVTVVFVAMKLGRAAGIWASILCVGCFDFFFVPPVLSFAISDTQYLFTCGLMLTVALITSELAERLRSEAKVAKAGVLRATVAAQVARDLSGAIETEQIVAVCSRTIAPLFGARAALVLPNRDGRLAPPRDAPFVNVAVAQWTYDNVQRAGLGAQTLSGAEALYLPLKGPMAPRGVLVLRPENGVVSDDPDDQRLLDTCCSSIALALERIHFADVAQETLVRMEGERLRNALLAAVSHDLKTPLTAIRGLAETIEQQSDLPRLEHMDLAASIRIQAEELQRVVTNLLDVARMQSDGVRLTKEWHALSEIVGSALARTKMILGTRPVRANLPANLPLLEVDAPLFERVLVNLLDNAMKYAGADATVDLHAGASGHWMSLFVEDDGPGLPTDDAECLFEPFTRGQKESSITGVGLGLALCRSIVSAHGGTIRATQRTPRGACFEIRLPLGTPPTIERESAA
jgi:two-component system sensor histidine kinase KdpD